MGTDFIEVGQQIIRYVVQVVHYAGNRPQIQAGDLSGSGTMPLAYLHSFFNLKPKKMGSK